MDTTAEEQANAFRSMVDLGLCVHVQERCAYVFQDGDSLFSPIKPQAVCRAISIAAAQIEAVTPEGANHDD